MDKETASWSWQTTLNLLLVASLVIGLMMAVPPGDPSLKQLAANADRLGRGEDIEPLWEEGPTEIRESIQAFNRMHTRLDRFVQDRTRMLAAISHDLRTPHHQPAAAQRVSGGRGKTRTASSRPCSRWSRCWRRP